MWSSRNGHLIGRLVAARSPIRFGGPTSAISRFRFATVTYTAGRAAPHVLADFIVQWLWPQLYTRGPDEPGWHANNWALQVQTSIYFCTQRHELTGIAHYLLTLCVNPLDYGLQNRVGRAEHTAMSPITMQCSAFWQRQ